MYLSQQVEEEEFEPEVLAVLQVVRVVFTVFKKAFLSHLHATFSCLAWSG